MTASGMLPSVVLTNCVCCGGKELVEYLNLGMQPPPNAVHDNINKPLTHELRVNICTTCWHGQLADAVNPDTLFNNYSYRTGVSETLKKHYYQFARDTILSLGSIPPNDRRVLDIGCNDGTLLSAFKEFNWETIGVDPCQPTEGTEGVDFYIEGYWNEQTIEKHALYMYFPLITATNVFAHTPDPLAFLKNCKDALAVDGTLILEFPYQLRIIQDKQFDTIYFEHISYFTVNSFVQLASRSGLYISDIVHSDVHGGSLRIYLKHCEFGEEEKQNSSKVASLIAKEKELGLFELETYKQFAEGINNIKNILIALTQGIKDTGHKLVGFGASGKGSVLLNFCELQLEYIVDETPGKIGKFSSGMNIPIVPLSRLTEETVPLCILIMVWNCLNECMTKINVALAYNKRWSASQPIEDKCIVYVPEVRIFNVK